MSNSGETFLRELKDFLSFLQSLWGLLGGISLFFPLSNVFLKQIIPIKSLAEDGSYAILDPTMIAALSTIVTFFVILDTFSKRHVITGTAVRRQAWLTFGFGILMFVLYLPLYKFNRHSQCGIDSGDNLNLLFEIPLMLIYCLIFASLTKAFMLLGMLEYFKKTDSPETPSDS